MTIHTGGKFLCGTSRHE